jgi:hypothetical protein
VNEPALEALEKRWQQRRAAQARTGRIARWMLTFLAAGTAVEYLLAVSVDANLPVMVAINIAEAAAIIWFFMHVSRAWRGSHDEGALR